MQICRAGGVRGDVVRVYEDPGWTRPIVVKVFTGSSACWHEEMTYRGREDVIRPGLAVREVGLRSDSIRFDFWGWGRDAVMLEVVGGIDDSLGRKVALTRFVMYDKGSYRVVDGPELTDRSYKFGHPIPGMQIIVAHAVWDGGGPPHRYRFERHVWNGKSYVKQGLGTTKQRYSPRSARLMR